MKYGIQRGKGRHVKSNIEATNHLLYQDGNEGILQGFLSLLGAQRLISNKWLFRTMSVNLIDSRRHPRYGTSRLPISQEDMVSELEALYEAYLNSQPDGNSFDRFYAFSLDEMSIEGLIQGENRKETLSRLEQYLVENVVFSMLQETDNAWYWQSRKYPQLVLLREWFVA